MQMTKGNQSLNTLAILIRLFLFWGIGIFFIMFLSLGIDFVVRPKNLFFFILGIMCMVILVVADWVIAGMRKSRLVVYGYLQDESMAPDFIVKSKYLNPFRIVLITLLFLTLITGIGTYINSAVVGQIAQATPELSSGLESDNPFIVAFNRTSPITFAELGFIGLFISIIASLIALTGANKNFVIILTAIFGTIAIIVIAVLWHGNAYGGNTQALTWIGFIFGLQALLIILTGSLIVGDIIHIFNNFTLGMMLTASGTAILKWGLPALFIALFIIWTIDRASFRKPRASTRARTKIGKTFQATGRFLFPVKG